ncbi:MAG: hypothetical protein ACPLSA_01710 [Caldanaerobacter sp.]
MKRFAEELREYGSIEKEPSMDGRNMMMVIAPKKQ